MPSPSSINSSKTFQHDDLHLWFRETQNMREVIDAVHGEQVTVEFTDRAYKEYSVFSGNYFSGSIDCVQDYKIGDKKYVLVVEMKPLLSSFSGICGQLNPYKKWIGDINWDNRKKKTLAEIKLVVLTYDVNTKYDDLYKDEGITLFRVSKEQTQIFK